MTLPHLTRRGFFGWLTGGTAAGIIPAAAPPARAWIIVAIGWEYNDEVSYQAGEYSRSELFYDLATAEAECRRLCSQFFTELYPTPADFEPDWDCYDLDRDADFDESTVTWDELRAAGFPDPYYVQELAVPGGATDE